jgi:hypothetical protein
MGGARIDGRVRNAKGESLSKLVLVELVDADDPLAGQRSPPNRWEYADFDTGQFSMDRIPTGTYLVGVNLTQPPSKKLPYPRTFLGDTTERRKAKRIKIDDGQWLQDLELRLPNPLPQVEIRISTVWPDGKPAHPAYAYLHDPEYPWHDVVGDAVTQVDKAGRATLIGFPGRKYWIQAIARLNFGNEICSEPFVLELSNTPSEIQLVLTEKSDYCSNYFETVWQRSGTTK